jgi:hypothetical protein
MADAYANFSTTPDSLGTIGAIVTPGDADLPGTVKGVVCLTAGNITVVPLSNDNTAALAFVDVPAGFVPPYRVRRVTAATATVATIEG